MTIAAQYARALHRLAEASPERAKEYLKNLREILSRSGRLSLLPRIYGEYERLAQRDARFVAYKRVDPDAERTRQLAELYRRLIA